jgi:hypothetical protein
MGLSQVWEKWTIPRIKNAVLFMKLAKAGREFIKNLNKMRKAILAFNE